MITVFISYSWDSEDHKEWVKDLADKLTYDGLKVLFDQYDLSIGKSLTHFMEQSLEKADKVLIILTPDYKRKAENRESGVGYEISLISQELYELQSDNNKFLPILRRGTFKESSPGYIKTLLSADLSSEDTFESDYYNLLRTIYDKPKVTRPKIGPEPDFDKIESDPIIERSRKIKVRVDLHTKKIAFINSVEGVNKSWHEISKMFQEIEKKANLYKDKSTIIFNATHNTHRCILYSEENFCVNFYWGSHCTNSLEDARLVITIWEGHLSLKTNGMDPFYKPSQKHGIEYRFSVDDDLQPIWISSQSETFSTADLIQKYFSLLLDYVVDRKEKKIK